MVRNRHLQTTLHFMPLQFYRFKIISHGLSGLLRLISRERPVNSGSKADTGLVAKSGIIQLITPTLREFINGIAGDFLTAICMQPDKKLLFVCAGQVDFDHDVDSKNKRSAQWTAGEVCCMVRDKVFFALSQPSPGQTCRPGCS